MEIDHRADASAEHERVTERVGVAAQQRDLPGHALEHVRAAIQGEAERVAVRDDRALEVAFVGDARGPAVAVTTAAANRGVALVESGHVDQPEHGLAVVEQRDQRREQRDPAREGDRAVDRVDHPTRTFGAALGAVLLAEDPVIRKRVAQRFADHALGLAVGFGDRRPVALRLHRDAAKAAHHLAARAVSGRLCGAQRVFERQRHD